MNGMKGIVLKEFLRLNQCSHLYKIQIIEYKNVFFYIDSDI